MMMIAYMVGIICGMLPTLCWCLAKTPDDKGCATVATILAIIVSFIVAVFAYEKK